MKMPTKVSARWWKDNVPDSIPRNKTLEDVLAQLERLSPGDVAAEVKRAADQDDIAKINSTPRKP